MLNKATNRFALSLLLLAIGASAQAGQLMLTGGPELEIDYHTGTDTIVFALAGRLWRSAADGGTATAVTSAEWVFGNPSISPNGRFVVAVGGRMASEQQLWLIDLDDPVPQRLTTGDWRDTDPVWHPTEPSVVFASDRSGSWQIWKQSIDGTVLQRLTREPGSARYPVYATERGVLIYVQSLPGRYEIRERYGAGRARALLTSTAPIEYPSARPEGVLVTFWERDADNVSTLRMLIPGPQAVVKSVPGIQTDVAQPIRWRDRDRFLLIHDGIARLQKLAATEYEPIHLTAWVSVRDAPGLPLRDAPAEPSARFVLRVGFLIDVLRQTAIPNRDLVIENGRIVEIATRQDWPGETVIDLPDSSVVPAMIDIDATRSPNRLDIAAGVFALDRPVRATDVPTDLPTPARDRFIQAIEPAVLIRSTQPATDLELGIHLAQLSPHGLDRIERLLLSSGAYIRLQTGGVLQQEQTGWQQLSASPLFSGIVRRPVARDAPALPANLHSRVIAGSDGTAFAAPLGLHANLMALSQLGMSNGEVLASATWRPAALLGFRHHGTIAEGNAADLIILADNPLERLDALLQPIAVVDAGVFRSVGGLLDL